MQSLKSVFEKARREGWAVPHFNISNFELLKAVVEAAHEKASPLLIGTSEGERDYIGLETAVALVRAYRETYAFPLYLNADHSYSVETAKAAVDAGYDSIHIDLSKKPLAENIAGTKEVVLYAKNKNPEISVEGEIGYFVTDSSTVYKKDIDVPIESLARPEEAVEFVEKTGVDRLAPVVGGIHGVARNAGHLDIERVGEIHGALPEITLVLHGGSGDPPEEIQAAIVRGIANVHISTDLRVAWREALMKEITREEYAPYKIMGPVVEAVKKIAILNIDIFKSAGRC
ncbi:MAG: class II fructose-bisphosphate aldolase [Candidatus Ryanbacteria bacterium]|nr:class II fructose-bisphosphate aldolase [Candidatus Ryanbacteria bacterium]